MSMIPTADTWRTLSEAELVSHPDAGLGGVLGLMTILAIVLGMLAAIPVAIFFLVIVPYGGFDPATFGNWFVPRADTPGLIGQIRSLQQGTIFLWAVVFALMTWTRASSTPRVASILIVVWVGFAMLTNIAIRIIASPDGLTPFAFVEMAPYMLFNIIVAAGFWGYMHEGRRPNLYYRRRVRVG